MYPRLRFLIAAGVSALAAVAGLAACGGGGSSNSGPPQTIRGPGFRFAAPGGWLNRRQGTQVSAAPKPVAAELVSVSRFPLLKPYSPALFAKVTKELDASAGDLAQRLEGNVRKRYTTTVAGQRVRQYLLLYPQNPKEPKQGDYSALLTYVLRGKVEYELFCRWAGDSKTAPEYCTQLGTSFRPV